MASSRDIRAGRAAVELSLADRGFRAQLAKAMNMLKAIGRIAANAMAVAGAAFVGAAAGVALLTRRFAKAGDALDKMAARTGVAVEQLSALGFAAEQSGGNLDDMERGLRGMARFMVNASRGLSSAQDTLDDLGLTLADVSGLAPAAQFAAFADAIGRVADPTMRAGLAMQVFGRAGSQLVPLISGGGFRELVELAERLNIPITTKQASQAAIMTDRFNELRRVLDRVGFSIGSVLAPFAAAFGESASQRLAGLIGKMDAMAATIRMAIGGALVAAVEGVKDFALGLALIETRSRVVAETLRAALVGAIAKVAKFLHEQLTVRIAGLIKAAGAIPGVGAYAQAAAESLLAASGGGVDRLEQSGRFDQSVLGQAASDGRGAIQLFNATADRIQARILEAIDRNTAAIDDLPAEPIADPEEAQAEAAESIAAALSRGLEVTQRQAEGGFSAALLARQIGGRDPAERTAKATERSADTAERIERAINASTGLAFA